MKKFIKYVNQKLKKARILKIMNPSFYLILIDGDYRLFTLE